MNTSGLILLIPDKPDAERDALANVWEQHGGEVFRLGRFWDPPALDVKRVRIHGGTSFVLVLQEKLGFELCTPADDLILSLPPEALKRRIQKQRLREAEHFEYPLFVKPFTPKLFAAHVYGNLAELRRECHGLGIDTAVFTSNAVPFVAEARTFILAGEVLDCAFYEGDGNVREAAAAAAHFSRSPILPRAVVLDIGLIKDQGWAVIEVNAAWGAGLNGCQAERIWPCIAAASGPQLDKPADN
jgi:hypothetical protein